MTNIVDHPMGEPKYADILGSRLAYWDINPHQTETIVMVHGFRGNHQGFRQIVPGLADYRLIIADLPGFGLSTPMTERRHDLAGYAAAFSALVDSLKLPRYHVFGHSFGSQVAAEWVTADSRFDRFLLLNPIAVSPRLVSSRVVTSLVDFYYALSCALPEIIGDRVLNNPLYAYALSWLLMTSHDRGMRRFIRRHHLSDMSYRPYLRVIREAYAASNTGVEDVVSGGGLTALIIAGDRDPIAPLWAQRRLLKAMPGSRLEVVAGAGHLMPLEYPERVAELIGQYLKD